MADYINVYSFTHTSTMPTWVYRAISMSRRKSFGVPVFIYETPEKDVLSWLYNFDCIPEGNFSCIVVGVKNRVPTPITDFSEWMKWIA
jgi:hypothetical protein